jgi:hypothetical protein
MYTVEYKSQWNLNNITKLITKPTKQKRCAKQCVSIECPGCKAMVQKGNRKTKIHLLTNQLNEFLKDKNITV